MATATLSRSKIKPRPKVAEETKQIAREAFLVLGYKNLAEKVLTREPLSEVLRRLDIRPYKAATVDAYKEKKAEAAGKRMYSWQRYQIVRTASEIPDIPPFALRKAIQIKMACPEVKLFVEQLEQDPDPFLVAKLDHEEFYIEVWDERDFEKGL